MSDRPDESSRLALPKDVLPQDVPQDGEAASSAPQPLEAGKSKGKERAVEETLGKITVPGAGEPSGSAQVSQPTETPVRAAVPANPAALADSTAVNKAIRFILKPSLTSRLILLRDGMLLVLVVNQSDAQATLAVHPKLQVRPSQASAEAGPAGGGFSFETKGYPRASTTSTIPPHDYYLEWVPRSCRLAVETPGSNELAANMLKVKRGVVVIVQPRRTPQLYLSSSPWARDLLAAHQVPVVAPHHPTHPPVWRRWERKRSEAGGAEDDAKKGAAGREEPGPAQGEATHSAK